MATRKLKFKPKPVVGGAVRRPREKEEIQESTSIGTDMEKEASLENIASLIDIDKDPNAQDNTNVVNEEIVSKRLRIELPEHALLDPPINYHGETSILYHPNSLAPDCPKGLNNEATFYPSNDKNCLNDQTEQHTIVKTGKLVSLKQVLTPSTESDTGLSVELTCSKDSTDFEHTTESNSISNAQTNKMPSAHMSKESSISLKSSHKTEAVRGMPRFGRSKFKPVLNNSVVRKKTETNDTMNSNENASCHEVPVSNDVYPIAIIRTESVIKCVKSEINKSNIGSEIADSFSALESEEPDLHHVSSKITPDKDKNESCENIRRFERVNDEVRTSTIVSDSNSQVYRVNTHNPIHPAPIASNIAQTDISEIRVSNLEPCEKTGKTDSQTNNQQTETFSSNMQMSSNKVAISPLKLTAKILVPKPSPNLLDTAVRRISFQGSDSEEESKRKSSLKNDPGLLGKKEKKEKKVKNNKRKLSQGSTYSKLGQEALEKFTQKFGKVKRLEPTEKAKLTMLDLIFYNPNSNPMSVNTEEAKVRKKEEKFEVSELVKEALTEEAVDDVEVALPAPAVPVPQLKVGPDGQIMLDPKSLVIETTEVKEKRAEMEKSTVVRESGITRYNTYSKKKHTRRDWSAQETLQFYKALNTIGSDFTLMTKLFPTRSRHELKLKFKKEEKTNMKLVDLAMTAPADFDFSSLEEEMKHENEEMAKLAEVKRLAIEAAKKAKAQKKEEKEKNKGKKSNYPKIMKVKDAAFKNFDETEIRDIAKYYNTKKNKVVKGKKKRVARNKKQDVPVVSSSDDEDIQIHIDLDSDEADREDNDLKLLKMIKQKTRVGTRRGRKIKKTKKLEEYEEINETLKKKLEEIESDSDDGYTPNGPGADMLFGSPMRDPFPDHPSHEAEGSQWGMEVTSVPSIENTVFDNNVDDVSELSELGSFGQSMTALDLSLPLRASMQDDIAQKSLPTNSVLNRHLITESIQIIDQLTCGENVNLESRNITLVGGSEEGNLLKRPAEEEPNENRMPLPSFESVSRSRLPIVYSVQEQYVPAKSAEDGSKIHDVSSPSLPVESSHQDKDKVVNQQEVVMSYYTNSSEECILGD